MTVRPKSVIKSFDKVDCWSSNSKASAVFGSNGCRLGKVKLVGADLRVCKSNAFRMFWSMDDTAVRFKFDGFIAADPGKISGNATALMMWWVRNRLVPFEFVAAKPAPMPSCPRNGMLLRINSGSSSELWCGLVEEGVISPCVIQTGGKTIWS